MKISPPAVAWALALLAAPVVLPSCKQEQKAATVPANRQPVTPVTVEVRPDGLAYLPGAATPFTGTAISAQLADKLGLPSRGTVRSSTANGIVTGQVVLADIRLQGGVQAERLRVVALPGLGDRPLLGMDVLGRLRWSQEAGVLRIRTGTSP